MKRSALLLLSLVPISIFSCSSEESTPLFSPGVAVGAGGAAGPSSCVPNQSVACPCIGSAEMGVQVCQSDGKSFTACFGCPQVSAGGAPGAGAGGASPAGASAAAGSGAVGPGAGGTGGPASGAGGTGAAGSGAAGTGGAPCSATNPAVDADGDGFTPAQGDCNDCDKNVNPGAVDLVERDAAGNPSPVQVDDDCSGTAATSEFVCDDGLPIALASPFQAARAMGLCNVEVEANPADPSKRKWGVVTASLSDISGPFTSSPVKLSGADLEITYGTLPAFGVSSPREGKSLFAISSGLARAEGQPGFSSSSVCSSSKNIKSTFPPGFPKEGSCGTTGEPNDGAALDLEIRVPTNARSFTFDYRFFTCEYPSYVCDLYNDVFAVLMSPSPLPAGDPMADMSNTLANVAFQSTPDGKKEVIGVNNQDFFTACNPGPMGYVNCKGEAQLVGTGFQGHGASGWVRAHVPVVPGSIIKLRIAIWDSGDGILDSTALVDRFAWSPEPVVTVYSEVLPGESGGAGGAAGAGGASQGGTGGASQGGTGGASQGGTGGAPFGGSSGAAGQPFGGSAGAAGTAGSAGAQPFGGASGAGGASAGSAGSGGNGAGGSMAGPCSDGTCSGPNECCKGAGMPCGLNLNGFCF